MFLKVSFLVLHFSHPALMTLMMLPVILLSLLMILDQAFDLCQQWELAFALKYDLWDTVNRCRKWLFDFNAGKSQLVLFGWSNNSDVFNVKVDGSVLKEKSFFKMLGLSFSFKLDWVSYIVCIAKTASNKIKALICSMKFLYPESALCFYKSIVWHKTYQLKSFL